MKPASRTGTALALLLPLTSAWAQDAAELDLDHTMSMELQTPHIKWARPYALGRLRVLLFCNGRGTVPREGVELKQRFDFDVDAVFWRRIVDTTRQGWHGSELGLKRMLRLAAKPYDCYLFLGVRPDQLSSEMQYKVLQPVVEGKAGIVMVGASDRRIFKPERRMDGTHRSLPDFVARIGASGVYRVGKGLGVLLPKRPNIPYEAGWQSDYEGWQERLGRAIVWAAGRRPEVFLMQAHVTQLKLDRAKLPADVVHVEWRNP
ncbi:MAG: hypothetical protein AMS14_04230, partial [Planctomycetes bacterium DG_20]